MLIFDRPSGKLFKVSPNSPLVEPPELIDFCYSGKGEGVNNPAMEHVHNVGPIPAGMYTLERASSQEIVDMHKGPDVYKLIPDKGNDMGGRDALSFLIHWNSIHQGFGSSEGCIIPLSPNITFHKILGETRLKVQ